MGVYLRISNDSEGLRLGVERQRLDTCAKCVRSDDVLIDVYIDNDISASTRSTKHRPEYERMIADAKSGHINKIVAYTKSRVTRRPRENEDLIVLAEDFGVVFEYVASPSVDLNTADGRLIARFLAAQDAAESERTSERATRKKLELARAGQFRGGPRPFGYEADGMAVRPAEEEIVQECTSRLLAGESLNAIAMDLNSRGVRTSRGGTWAADSVRDVLSRARNAGLVESNGEIIGPAAWSSIVDEMQWRAVRALLADPSRLQHQGVARKWLGSGLYLCGVCDDGTTLRATTIAIKGKGRTRGYRCRALPHLARSGEPIDDLVERAVVKLLADPGLLAQLADTSDVDVKGLQAEATAIAVRMRELDDELDDRLITKANHARRHARLAEKLTAVNGTLAQVSAGTELDGLAGNPLAAELWYGVAPDGSDGLPVGRRAAVVNRLVRVTVLKPKMGRLPQGVRLAPGSVLVEPNW